MSNIPLKNLIKNIQARDDEYKIALPQFNQLFEMRNNKNTGSEFSGLKAEVKDRISKIKKLETKVLTQLKRLGGKELGKRKEGEQYKFNTQYKEVLDYVKEQQIKFFAPKTQGGGLTWLDDEQKVSQFREGITTFDAQITETETLSTVVQGDGDQDLEGFGDVKTPRTPPPNTPRKKLREIEETRLAKEAAKKAQMVAEMKEQIPEVVPPSERTVEEAKEEADIIDLDKEEKIKTKSTTAVIENHEDQVGKPTTIVPEADDPTQTETNKAVGDEEIETELSELQQGLDAEAEQKQSEIGNALPREKVILEDTIPTYEQEIPREGGGKSVSFTAEAIDTKKSIETLKDEIRALHLLYDSKIPAFKSKPHQGQKNDALKSKKIAVVRRHHADMMKKVKEYFSTGGLKLGVIIDAQDYLNNQFPASLNPVSLEPMTEGQPIMRDRSSFERGGIAKRQINFKQTYIRGGLAHAKGEPIRNRIPSYTPHKVGKHKIPALVHQTNTIHPETLKRSRNVGYTNISFKTRK